MSRRRNTFKQRLHFFRSVSNKCFFICRKLILIYKLLQGDFGMKDIDFMCVEKHFPQEAVTIYVDGKN